MKLSKEQISEIRDGARELSGPRLREYFATLVGALGTSESKLYRLTQDLRKRKRRWDAGSHRRVIPPIEQLQWMMDLTVRKNMPANGVISQAAEHFGKEFVGITVPQYNSLLRESNISLRFLRKASDNKCFAHKDPTYHWRLFYFTSENFCLFPDGTVVWRRRAGAEPDSSLDRSRCVWLYAIVDCRSSLRFRWAYRDHNSFNLLDFMSRALKELGVPKTIYADEDPVHTEKIQTALASLGCEFVYRHRVSANKPIEDRPNLGREVPTLLNHQWKDLNEFRQWLLKFDLRTNLRRDPYSNRAPIDSWRRQNLEACPPPDPNEIDEVLFRDSFSSFVMPGRIVSFLGRKIRLPKTEPFISMVGQSVKIAASVKKATGFCVLWQGSEYFVKIPPR